MCHSHFKRAFLLRERTRESVSVNTLGATEDRKAARLYKKATDLHETQKANVKRRNRPEEEAGTDK